MSVVAQHVGLVPDPTGQPWGYYPAIYRNDEPHGRNFQQFENRKDRTLYEVPLAARFDMDRRGATLRQINNAENVHPNDRARVAQSSLNDPGPFRGVVPFDRTKGRAGPAIGVIYHPQDRPAGYSRAPVEPMDRNGRQSSRRYMDNNARVHRVVTWPPRDEDGANLATYEERHEQVRKPRRRQ